MGENSEFHVLPRVLRGLAYEITRLVARYLKIDLVTVIM